MFRDYRIIENYPDYVISNYGKVYSLKRGKVREMKQQTGDNGYLQVGLCKDGIQKTSRIHALVGNHFIGKRQGEMTFDHIDRDKNNNRADNLRLATKSEQQQNTGVSKNNKLGVKCINISLKKGVEYYHIRIKRNKKRVFRKSLNKNKFTLDDAIKVRDEFLLQYNSALS